MNYSDHAPLLERLRGQAFLPGVHYAVQADEWMREAADEIERLQSTIDQALRSAHVAALFRGGAGEGELSVGFFEWIDWCKTNMAHLEALVAEVVNVMESPEGGCSYVTDEEGDDRPAFNEELWASLVDVRLSAMESA